MMRQADRGAERVTLFAGPAWWPPPNSRKRQGRIYWLLKLFLLRSRKWGRNSDSWRTTKGRHGWAQGSPHLPLQGCATFSTNGSDPGPPTSGSRTQRPRHLHIPHLQESWILLSHPPRRLRFWDAKGVHRPLRIDYVIPGTLLCQGHPLVPGYPPATGQRPANLQLPSNQLNSPARPPLRAPTRPHSPAPGPGISS